MAQVTFSPPFCQPATVADSLRHAGYAVLAPADVARWIGCDLAALMELNRDWASLPPDLKAIVEACCRAANVAMLAEYTARNLQALALLRDEHGVDFRPLPPDVLAALRQASREVLEEAAAKDPFARRVYDSMRAFQAGAQAWHGVSEEAWYRARA